MWKILNFFQGTLIFVWTAFCALFGLVLLLISFNVNWSHRINSYYIWSPIITLIAGVRVKATGQQHVPADKVCIFVANHESLFDIVAIARSLDRALFFIAKKELLKVPFMGWYMWLVGMVFIDRSDKIKARESLISAASKVRNGKNIISFPEGTRARTQELMMFKRGSFILAREAGVPIIPVAIIGARQVIPPGSFRLRPGRISVEFGSPMHPDDFLQDDVDAFASAARQKVLEMIEHGKSGKSR